MTHGRKQKSGSVNIAIANIDVDAVNRVCNLNNCTIESSHQSLIQRDCMIVTVHGRFADLCMLIESIADHQGDECASEVDELISNIKVES